MTVMLGSSVKGHFSLPNLPTSAVSDTNTSLASAHFP